MKNMIFLLFLNFSHLMGQAFQDYKLEMVFKPSFHLYSKWSVVAIGDSSSIRIESYLPETDTIKWTMNSKLPPLFRKAIESTLNTYDFKTTSNFDSSFRIENGERIISYSYGFDGIDVIGSYIKGSDTLKFGFWSPDSGSKNSDLALLMIVIGYNLFSQREEISHVETLEEYFHFKLPIREVDRRTSLYRLYAIVKDYHAEQLREFVEKKQPVIVEASNCHGIYKELRPLFKNWVHEKKLVWINPSQDLLEIGGEIGLDSTKTNK